jgi:DNA replication protein DnaC
LTSKSQSSPDRGTRRRTIALENALAKLDKYDLLVLDDIVYVSKDQAETSVPFELIGSRYERRSMLITANQPFGDWGKIFRIKL